MTMTVSPTENPLTLATVTVFCPDVEVAVTGVAVVLAIVVPEETVRSGKEVVFCAREYEKLVSRRDCVVPALFKNEIELLPLSPVVTPPACSRSESVVSPTRFPVRVVFPFESTVKSAAPDEDATLNGLTPAAPWTFKL
jgi:hypothetical protein